MRTGKKVEIIHYLLKLVPECIFPSLSTVNVQFVVDGGGLLYKFSWPKHSTYTEICEMYV
jgi:hypothetical protein